MDPDLREKTIFFARAGMELLQPGNNNLTTAARGPTGPTGPIGTTVAVEAEAACLHQARKI